MSRGGLARARHDAGQGRGGAAPAADRALPRRGRVRPRARAQPRGRGRRRVPRRGREPARARRPLPPLAARAVLGARRAARRSTPGAASPPRRPRGRSRSGASRSSSSIGERHLKALDTIVDPLLVPDLATVVWAPHSHAEAIDSLRRLMQVVLVDSQDEPDCQRGARARQRAARERLRRRPRVAALDAVARARRRRLQPAGAAARARRDLARHGAPPRRLDRRGGAVLRLAVLAAGLAAGLVRRRRRQAAHRARPRAPRRGGAAPRRGRAAGRARPRRA